MRYQALAELYAQLEKTPKRLEKTFYIAQFLTRCPREDLKTVLYLLHGRVFAQGDERKLGMSSQLLIKVIAQATGEEKDAIEKEWKKRGDLGLVAEHFVAKKKQRTLFGKPLTIEKVTENIARLAGMVGEGAVQKKIGVIGELLGSASPLEARYIVRTITGELRAGVGDSALRDALVWAFYPRIVGIFYRCESCKTLQPQTDICLVCGKHMEGTFSEEVQKKFSTDVIVPTDEKEARERYTAFVEEVEHAFNVSNDLGVLAELLAERGPKGLKKAGLTPGKAMKVMLYTRVKDIPEGFEVVGKPALLEPKFDGFHMQIHRHKETVKLFTKNLEDVTTQFPDVIARVKNHIRAKEYILDAEVVGIDPQTKRVLPFQHISQRIKRKYYIEALAKKLPVAVHVFDAMALNGETLLNIPFVERRKRLRATIKEEKNSIALVEQLETSDVNTAEKYYHACLAQGHEGIMMKNIQGIYKPGKRVGYGVKIKPVMESLDLVIVAAEWGEGKRARWLSSFTVACRDKEELKEVGKVSTGLKEKSEGGVRFLDLTKELQKYILQEKGREVIVKPKIVVEVLFEEIQVSPSYSSGYGLRFPRIVRVRNDKGLSDIATLEEIKHFYREQK